MKKRRKPQRRSLSAGTVIMLLMTVFAIVGCTVFLMIIAGDEMNSRAHELKKIIAQTGANLLPEIQHTPSEIITPRLAAYPAETQTPLPEEKTHQIREREVSSFTLAAAGTIYAPKAIRSSAQTETGDYDFTPVFSGLGDVLSSADLAIATLETMTTGEEKGSGNYDAPAALLDALRETGVDLVSLGTEHALDMGYEGLQITAGELTARGIMHAGVSLNDYAENRTNLIGINGIQTAVLAYCYGLSEESKEAASPQEQAVLHSMDVKQMVQDIRQARVDGADVVIVLPHWGTKNKQETPEELRAMAKTLAQAGADVILGTHPNVVQGTERLTVTRSDGLEYDAVVCYSLGSLLTDARTEENTAGMIAHLQIYYDPALRRVSLGTRACLPVYIARQKEDGQVVYRIVDVENTEAMEALDAQEAEAARYAAELVRGITGQSDMEDEGQG